MGYWVTRTYVSGKVGEKTKYYIAGNQRNRKKIRSAIKKQEQNSASTEKQMARLLNINFGAGDLLIGLDYSDKALGKLSAKVKDAEDEDTERYKAAVHNASLLIRRVKRELAKDSIDIMFIGITSDLDGKTGEIVRLHHHIVMRGVSPGRSQAEINKKVFETVKAKWTDGAVDVEYLSQQDDYTPIAHYFIKQVRRIDDAKKYSSSRNLVRPTFKDRVVSSNAELRIPPRAKILFRSEYAPYKPQYVRYIINKNQRE
mgnify:CR=1 FL=1